MNPEIIKTLKKADNESTRAPYWMILDPKRQLMSKDIHELASMITGPFFSREDAQKFLTATHYNFSQKAKVFCFSGCYSRKYCDFYDEIDRIKFADSANNIKGDCHA